MLKWTYPNIVHLDKKYQFSNGRFACFPMEGLFGGLLPRLGKSCVIYFWLIQ